MENRIETNKQPHEVIDVVLQSIDLYWDNLLEYPQNTIRVTARDMEEGTGRMVQEIYTIQRVYNTAYWIKCERSELSSWGGSSPVMGTPIDTIEYRMIPTMFDAGKIGLRVTDTVTGITIDEEILMDKLEAANKTAAGVLHNLQLNLLALLIGHSRERPLFDPFPVQVKQLLEVAYGKDMADELWRTGMSDKTEDEN